MHAVVTGSEGFVGRVLMPHLPAASRIHMASPDWRAAVEGADYRDATVVHLAARVHQASAAEPAWLADNVEKTCVLAEAAARGGAARFIFASTLKVHGDESGARAVRPDDPFSPQDAYARSKAAAEERLAEIGRRTALRVAVVRPPLVFGPGARANLHSAVRLAASHLPLPFAAIRNRRSWIHVEDLCAFIAALSASDATGAFIPSHSEPFSTPQLFTELRAALHRSPSMFSVDPARLERMAAIVGRRAAARRLTRSLEGDNSTALGVGWRPRVDFSRAVRDVVEARG